MKCIYNCSIKSIYMEHMQHLNWASVYIAKLRGQFAA